MIPPRILVATRSTGKQREARQLLERAGTTVVFPNDVGIWELPDEARLELGDTFEANAVAKAEHFARRSGLPTVADDSGLEVLSLGGDPGVRSKRWAGVEGADEVVAGANNRFLLERLRGAPQSRRRAAYRCVLAWVPRVGAIPQCFEGTCHGRILEGPAGTGGFGYDPLFWSDDLGKAFGEAAPEEKDRVSHRGRAFARLIAHLEASA